MLKANNPTSHWSSREDVRILKNVLVISISSMLFFTGFTGAADIQSSINTDPGVPMAALSAMFSAVIVSSFFLPAFIIKWLNPKWTMVVCFIGYVPYIVSQLRPSYSIMIPAAIAAGLSSAPVWCAMCTYIALLSEAYSKVSSTPIDVLLSRHLGVFFFIFHLNQVWGNLISSSVISTKENQAAVTQANATQIPDLCGINFLPSEDIGKAIHEQPKYKIELLIGIELLFMAVAALLVSVALDSPSRFKDNDVKNKKIGLTLLMATLKISVEPNQLLMIFISAYVGMMHGFVTSDFSPAYVACAVGPGTVGYVLMTYGLTNAVMSILTGFLIKVVGRVPVTLFILCVNIAIFVTMLMWRLDSNVTFIFYVLSFFLAVCYSTWLVTINSFYAILCPGREEAAFASFRLFEAIGFTTTFGISPYFRMQSKLYMILTTLILGSIGYFIVEYRHSKRNRNFDLTKRLKKGCDNETFDSQE